MWRSILLAVAATIISLIILFTIVAVWTIYSLDRCTMVAQDIQTQQCVYRMQHGTYREDFKNKNLSDPIKKLVDEHDGISWSMELLTPNSFRVDVKERSTHVTVDQDGNVTIVSPWVPRLFFRSKPASLVMRVFS